MSQSDSTRREFLKASALAVGAAGAPWALAGTGSAPAVDLADARDAKRLRVGLIGCGGRGRGALLDVIRAAKPLEHTQVEVTALADVFPEYVQEAHQLLVGSDDPAIRQAAKIEDNAHFVGFDAYRRLLDGPVDYVLIACPPYFHSHFAEAAIDAGKHVFCEKPGAIDMPGVRKLLRAGRKATEKQLGFLGGTQRRHQPGYRDIIGRIHEGAIGKPLHGQAYWNNNGWKAVPKASEWPDVEWHIRNWRMCRWLSGDLPGVLVIHYLDVMNWALNAVPESAYGVGGRQHWTAENPNGNIYDHFQCTLTYSDDRTVNAMCRVIPADAHHAEMVFGTKGTSKPGEWIKGADRYRYRGKSESPYILEHRNLLNSIHAGKPLNEAAQLAEASLTAIMMREAGYTGRVVTRDFLLNESERVLGPAGPPDTLAFGPRALEPVAVQGVYELE
jgi:myo-inositol 2-dehydrogenase/D-chiro-inositol 1-dehydrogenase